MGLGKDLSGEKTIILAHHKTVISGNKIASEVGRSSKAVHKFLKHSKSKKSKEHSKMTPRDTRNVWLQIVVYQKRK